jgi:hypothetical protein
MSTAVPKSTYTFTVTTLTKIPEPEDSAPFIPTAAIGYDLDLVPSVSQLNCDTGGNCGVAIIHLEVHYSDLKVSSCDGYNAELACSGLQHFFSDGCWWRNCFEQTHLGIIDVLYAETENLLFFMAEALSSAESL